LGIKSFYIILNFKLLITDVVVYFYHTRSVLSVKLPSISYNTIISLRSPF